MNQADTVIIIQKSTYTKQEGRARWNKAVAAPQPLQAAFQAGCNPCVLPAAAQSQAAIAQAKSHGTLHQAGKLHQNVLRIVRWPSLGGPHAVKEIEVSDEAVESPTTLRRLVPKHRGLQQIAGEYSRCCKICTPKLPQHWPDRGLPFRDAQHTSRNCTVRIRRN